jgi:hypothetical protein
MDIYITKEETDFATLAAKVARSPRAAVAVRARLEALNPQFSKRVPKGGVLVLPGGPDIKAGAGSTVRGTNLDELAERFKAGTREAAKRAGTRLEQLTAERTAVRDALKTAAAKRLVESDPLLQKQLAAAEAHFKAEQKRTAEATEQLKKSAELAEAEMAKLQKLFG